VVAQSGKGSAGTSRNEGEHLASLLVVAKSLGDEGDAPLLQVAQVRLNSRRKRTHRPAHRRPNAHDARDARIGQDLLVMAAHRRQLSGGSQLLHLLPPQPVSARRACVVPAHGGGTPGGRVELGARLCRRWQLSPMPYFHRQRPLSQVREATHEPLKVAPTSSSQHAESMQGALEAVPLRSCLW